MLLCFRYPPSLFSTLLGKYNLDGVKSIQWGNDHEEVAIKVFEQATQKKVSPTGIWLHPSGILGASPDGLVEDNGLIEVKCPYKHRMSTGIELQEDKTYCFDGPGKLKTAHSYYHQMQGQMAILNKAKCYLMIWTTKEAVVVEVERENGWGNKNILGGI